MWRSSGASGRRPGSGARRQDGTARRPARGAAVGNHREPLVVIGEHLEGGLTDRLEVAMDGLAADAEALADLTAVEPLVEHLEDALLRGEEPLADA